eukprot:TRINITY_DN5613_c0_g1_i4.p1 TRINITY_DN5613_c0_g1~~TRINITY_DN5613_c0_g1_i4.p1  ORF type:complete len:775 (+),score=153.63 TRINITY_DN5613_c0_g1_i4:44-2368(+)
MSRPNDEFAQSVQSKWNVDLPLLQREGTSKLSEALSNATLITVVKDVVTRLPNDHYNLLLSGITHSSSSVSESCIQTVAYLVKKSKLDIKSALNDLQICIPSIAKVSALNVAVDCVISLLIQGLEAKKKAKEDLYETKQAGAHPLVAILKSRTDSFQILVSRLSKQLRHIDSKTINAPEFLDSLWPFFSAVLCDPSFAANNLHQYLHAELIRLARTQTALKLDILFGLISFLPIYPKDSLVALSFLINAYEDILLETRSPNEGPWVMELGLKINESLLQILCEQKSSQGDILPFLQLLKKSIDKVPGTILMQTSILVLAWLLSSASELEQQEIIELLRKIVDFVQVIDLTTKCQTLLPFLIYPLLQLISSSNTTLQGIAASLLRKVELAATAGIKDSKTPTFSVDDRKFSSIHGALSLIANGESFLLSEGNASDNLENWLNEVRQKLSSKEQITDFSAFFLAPFLLHLEPKVRIATCDVISRIAQLSPMSGLSFLPLIIYQLGRETDAEAQLKLLYVIPTLATHQACITPVLRTLVPFTQVASMKAVGIRLLVELWKLQERTFPRLEGIITQYSPDENVEVRISIASALSDISAKKPQRGAELISVISKILSQDSHPTPAALALQALDSLCTEDIVEFKTAWGVISRSLANETRPLVLHRLAQFLGHGSVDASSENEEDVAFVSHLMSKLWQFAKSSSALVRRSAFRTMRRYAEVNADSLGADISPTLLVQLLADEDVEARTEAQLLAAAVVKAEVASRILWEQIFRQHYWSNF